MMAHDGQILTEAAVLADLTRLTADTLPEVEALFVAAREGLRADVTVAGKVQPATLEAHQFRAHALAPGQRRDAPHEDGITADGRWCADNGRTAGRS